MLATRAVGWVVVLDASTWCVECFPTEESVRRHWAGDDGEGVLVGTITGPLARRLGCTCWQCGKPLAT